MTVYMIKPNLDHPLFEGLYLERRDELLEFWPKDWHKTPWTWEAPRLKDRWPTPPVTGNVRRFNDLPDVNLNTLAFSQRAVDVLRDMLEPNGELLPVKHKIGTFYVYNCTTLVNCLDLERSEFTKYKKTMIISMKRFYFIESLVKDLTIFRLRSESSNVFCTQPFVDRVNQHGLQGFVFIKLWSSEKGSTDWLLEWKRAARKAEKIRPGEGPPVPVKGNTVVIRLYTEKKKASKAETAAANRIMDGIETRLYDAGQAKDQDYFGNIEGHDVVDHEIRIFMSAPDCHRLVEHLRPYLKKLPWKGRYQVLKRFGEYVDIEAREEYVRLD